MKCPSQYHSRQIVNQMSSGGIEYKLRTEKWIGSVNLTLFTLLRLRFLHRSLPRLPLDQRGLARRD